MKIHTGISHNVVHETDKVMSIWKRADIDKAEREQDARKFEQIVRNFRVQHGLEVSNG